VQDYLLCSDCEQRLGTDEQWVVEHCYRGPGEFKLQTTLRRSPVVERLTNGLVLSAVSPDVDLTKIARFAASIFWRASVHTWIIHGHTLEGTPLGKKYEEDFRRYILGEAHFPASTALWVGVSNEDNPALLVNAPVGAREATYHHHSFVIPGMVFDLFVGSRIPIHLERGCMVHGQQNPIYLLDNLNDVMRQWATSFKNTRMSQGLKKLKEKDLATKRV
jgi:hypothetical protein